MRRFVPALLAITLIAAAPAPHRVADDAGTPVAMQPQPGTKLDAVARQLTAQDLGEARRTRDRPLVLIGTAKLSSKAGDGPALFVQLQSARECGSAGCSTQVYVERGGRWVRVLDSAEGRMAVSPRHTKGMADLLADKERYVWDGTEYRDANPAPVVDLRPRRRR